MGCLFAPESRKQVKANRRQATPAKRSRRSLGDARGAVFVEFLAAFTPLFLSFWCLLQSAGVFAGNLVVRHSAVLGARAAAVVIPDNPNKYKDEEVGKVE